jgi:predicted HicB family RNase H-like nuclease
MGEQPVNFKAELVAYKGYPAQIEVDTENDITFGKVLCINAVLTFEGETFEEAVNDFHYVINDYLNWCKERGKEPCKPFSLNN